MKPAHKVMYNTGILYLRALLTVVVSLYTTRLVLAALGAEDFGIYALIGGAISMLTFLSAALSASTQRYFSYYQGTSDEGMQRNVFTASWVMHLGVGVGLVLVLEAILPLLSAGVFNIEPDRMPAARMVYHAMTFSIFVTIAYTPFQALLNAHENMLWYAVVIMGEVLLKFGIALTLTFFSEPERLTIYAVMMAALSVISFLAFGIFCAVRYPECDLFNFRAKKSLLKELASFGGWNLFGALCSVGRTQGLAMILNTFFGTVINAAFGLANQVAGQLNFFAAMLMRAINPQITKSEGMDNRSRMLRLSMMACKFGFFLLAFVAIPCCFEMPAILALWLKEVPDYAVIFCTLILLGALMTQLTAGLSTALQATGNISRYQATVGTLRLLNLPLSYAMLYFGLPSYVVLVSFVIIEGVVGWLILRFSRNLAGLDVQEFFRRVFAKEVTPVAVAVGMCLLCTMLFEGRFRFLVTGTVSSLAFFPAIYFFGLCHDEKQIIDQFLSGAWEKIKDRMNIRA